MLESYMGQLFGPIYITSCSFEKWSAAIPRLQVVKINGDTCVVGFVHGSCLSEASRRDSDVNKQMDLVFYLFLTGVHVVPEPSDTSTTNMYIC